MSDWSKPQSRLFSVYSPWWITFYVRLIAFACILHVHSHLFTSLCQALSIDVHCQPLQGKPCLGQLLTITIAASRNASNSGWRRGSKRFVSTPFLTVLYGFMCGLCQHIIVLHKVADSELLQFLDVFAWQRCLGMPAPFPCGLKVFIIIYT